MEITIEMSEYEISRLSKILMLKKAMGEFTIENIADELFLRILDAYSKLDHNTAMQSEDDK